MSSSAENVASGSSSTTTPPKPATIPYPPLQEGETYEQLEIMLAGDPYIASDKYLTRLRDEFQAHLLPINREMDTGKRVKMLENLLNMPKNDKRIIGIMAPFWCEYGFPITLGDEVYIGPNAIWSDVNKSEQLCSQAMGLAEAEGAEWRAVTIGDRTMFGPYSQLYTPGHPIVPEARNGLKGPEWAKPITVGSDCWIGGGVIILGGVTIGNGVTVGAGSVVTKDVPDRCVVVGNPARVVKRIELDGTVVDARQGK